MDDNENSAQMDDNANTALKPRSYQNLILDICLKKNTIIYLPTGAGKTFIALLAMKYLAKDLDKWVLKNFNIEEISK